jgi:Fur family ferric uptake transcriptional regulator/Fur family peroxide stress response transcriptional regulator
VILDILRSTNTHPTADWIYSKAIKHIRNLSLGTVYRNLGVLSKEGLIKKLDFGLGQARYDGVIDSHIHIICNNCGQISELMESPKFSNLDEIEAKSGFTITDAILEVHGYCPKCKSAEFGKKDE